MMRDLSKELDVVMIVRNEKRYIAAAVRNARMISKSVIVCDTGSTDGTIKLAREAGAKIVTYRWNDDFAAARNYAISQSKARYVLVQDADMRFVVDPVHQERDARRSIGLAIDSNAPGAALWVHDVTRQDASATDVLGGTERIGSAYAMALLFRRELGGDIYSGRVHECPKVWLESHKALHGPVAILQNAHVIHLGGTPEVRAERGKAERNVALLLSRIETDPSDGTAYSYLIHEYLGARQFVDAAKLSEAGWPIVQADPRARGLHTIRFLCGRMWLLTAMRDWKGLLADIAIARAIDTDHPDLWTFEAIAYQGLGEFGKAEAISIRAREMMASGNYVQCFTSPEIVTKAIAQKRPSTLANETLAGVA